MPPVANPYCKVVGCQRLRHKYPSGQRAQYCRQHMRRRKAKQREGFDSMTGQMLDVLRYLRTAQEQDREWCALGYPLAHGITLNALVERDWIFSSDGMDGTRYKITGRGLKALDAYETPAQRRDGICARCGERPRHVTSGGRRISYCMECERERSRKRNNASRKQPGICKRCKSAPKQQYSSGNYADLCIACERARGREKNRRARQQQVRAIQQGGPVPLCVKCKTAPVRVFANSVSRWCAACGRVEIRRYKLRAMLRRSGLQVTQEAAGD